MPDVAAAASIHGLVSRLLISGLQRRCNAILGNVDDVQAKLADPQAGFPIG